MDTVEHTYTTKQTAILVCDNFLVIYFSGISLFICFYLLHTHIHLYKSTTEKRKTQASVRKPISQVFVNPIVVSSHQHANKLSSVTRTNTLTHTTGRVIWPDEG